MKPLLQLDDIDCKVARIEQIFEFHDKEGDELDINLARNLASLILFQNISRQFINHFAEFKLLFMNNGVYFMLIPLL